MVGKLARGGLAAVFIRWASGLRFPFVFLLVVALFILDILIPDMIPFVDEIILGLVATLLANLRKKPAISSSPGTR